MSNSAAASPRSRIRLAAAGALMLATVTGAAPPTLAAPATVRIGGTGAALGAMQLLADAFMAQHPDIEVVVVPSLGTGGGIKALLAGAIDLALASRALEAKEQAQPIVAIEYARTPFVFATRADTATSALTLEQLMRIYDGTSMTWPDGSPLRLVLRPPSDSDVQFLRALSEAMDRAVQAAAARPGLLVEVTDQENADTLEQLRGSLGTFSLGQIQSERRRLKALAIGGVTPSPASLASGEYPYGKSLYVVRRNDTAPSAEAFLAFIRSPAGAVILEGSGHLPVVATGSE